MKSYSIINAQGVTINKVNASLDFLQRHYPDHTFELIVKPETENVNPSVRPVIKVKRIQVVTDPLNPIDLPIEPPSNIVSFKSSEAIEVEIHITDETGTPLPIDRMFSMPLAGQLGSSPRILDVDFVGGVATLTIGGWASGRWRVTEKEINMDLTADDLKFSFAGLTIKVRE